MAAETFLTSLGMLAPESSHSHYHQVRKAPGLGVMALATIFNKCVVLIGHARIDEIFK